MRKHAYHALRRGTRMALQAAQMADFGADAEREEIVRRVRREAPLIAEVILSPGPSSRAKFKPHDYGSMADAQKRINRLLWRLDRFDYLVANTRQPGWARRELEAIRREFPRLTTVRSMPGRATQKEAA